MSFHLPVPNPTSRPIFVPFDSFCAVLCVDPHDRVTLRGDVAIFQMAGRVPGYPDLEIPVRVSDGSVEIDLLAALYVIRSDFWLPSREVKVATRRGLFQLIRYHWKGQFDFLIVFIFF